MKRMSELKGMLRIKLIPVILFLFKQFAIASIYARRIVLYIWHVLFCLPDICFLLIPGLFLFPNAAQFRSGIPSIVCASSDDGDITKRFSMFLSWFWEGGDMDESFTAKSFRWQDFLDVFDSRLLTCTFVINNGPCTLQVRDISQTEYRINDGPWHPVTHIRFTEPPAPSNTLNELMGMMQWGGNGVESE